MRSEEKTSNRCVQMDYEECSDQGWKKSVIVLSS